MSDLICCMKEGFGCRIHHGEDRDVIREVTRQILTNGYIIYGKIISDCYSSTCATKSEVTWTVDSLINEHILTESYDSIGLDKNDKKYIFMFSLVKDKNEGRI